MRKRSIPVLLPTFLVLGLLGAWAGSSAGQLPPPPTVSLPTVSLPTVTVPPAPLPPAPPPPPLPTVTTPTVSIPPTPPPPVEPPKPPVDLPVTVPLPGPVPVPETPATPQSEPPRRTSTPSGEAEPSAGGRHYGASSRIATITRVRAARPWITVSAQASASERGVWITFWLSRARTVVFLVDELAPECRYVGKFLVRGRTGRNEVRFHGRLRGRALDTGTYRLTAHPRGDRARRLTGVTVVILGRPPGPAEITASRARNTCPGGTPPSLRAADIASAPGRGGPTAGVAGVQASEESRRPYEDEALGGPLATAVDALHSAADAVPPVLFALALLAVLLLGVAAMPQPMRASRAGATLVHHRGTIALAGVGVLMAAISFSLFS